MKKGDYVKVIGNSAGHSCTIGKVYSVRHINNNQISLVDLDGQMGSGWAYPADVELITDREELKGYFNIKVSSIRENIVAQLNQIKELQLKIDVVGRFSTIEEEHAYFISKFIDDGTVGDKDIAVLLKKYCC